ncbi:MAG: ATP-binding protein [Atribacterota bacterium]
MNPFHFGKEYVPECFIDREKEYAAVCSGVAHGLNLVLIAPRRFGKTWLLQKFMKESGFPVLYVDLFGVLTPYDFAAQLIQGAYAILREENPVAFVSQHLRKLAHHVSFSLSLKGVSFSLNPTVPETESLSEALHLPQSLASALKNRVVVILDEFQEYERILPELPGYIRSVFQKQEEVSYIFSGSRKHMLEKLFFQASGPLYYSAKRVDLGSFLPKEETIQYLEEQFQKSGKPAQREALEHLYAITRGHPYYVQFVSYEVWNLATRWVTKDIVDAAVDTLLHHESYNYDVLLEALGYRHLKKVLSLLASKEREIFNPRVLARWGISSPALLQKILTKLIDYGIVEKLSPGKYEILDPLFAMYVERRFVYN